MSLLNELPVNSFIYKKKTERIFLPELHISLLDDLGEGVVLQDVLLQLLLNEDNLLFEVLDSLLAVLIVIGYQVPETLVGVVVGHLFSLCLPELLVCFLYQIVDVLRRLYQLVPLFAVVLFMYVQLFIDLNKVGADGLVLSVLLNNICFDFFVKEIFLFCDVRIDLFKSFIHVNLQLFQTFLKVFFILLFPYFKVLQSFGMIVKTPICVTRIFYMLICQSLYVFIQTFKIFQQRFLLILKFHNLGPEYFVSLDSLFHLGRELHHSLGAEKVELVKFPVIVLIVIDNVHLDFFDVLIDLVSEHGDEVHQLIIGLVILVGKFMAWQSLHAPLVEVEDVAGGDDVLVR